MLRLRRQPDEHVHSEDVDRIVRVFAARGRPISRELACAAWREYSAAWAAGWMELPEDDEMLFDDCMDQLADEPPPAPLDSPERHGTMRA
jgi:hypothetical protein